MTKNVLNAKACGKEAKNLFINRFAIAKSSSELSTKKYADSMKKLEICTFSKIKSKIKIVDKSQSFVKILA